MVGNSSGSDVNKCPMREALNGEVHLSPGIPISHGLRSLGDYSSFRDGIQGTLMLLGARKTRGMLTSNEAVRNQDPGFTRWVRSFLPVNQLALPGSRL